MTGWLGGFRFSLFSAEVVDHETDFPGSSDTTLSASISTPGVVCTVESFILEFDETELVNISEEARNWYFLVEVNFENLNFFLFGPGLMTKSLTDEREHDEEDGFDL